MILFAWVTFVVFTIEIQLMAYCLTGNPSQKELGRISALDDDNSKDCHDDRDQV